ncbi:MAG: hypothetical protein IPJ40_21255 [Saprospirales bacterium]|nr:hypothetical protein [Saprospirales bacterium]
MDVLAESQRFDLFVDGKKWVEFFSPLDNEKTSWSVYGDEGAVLTFTRTMIDKHKDQMGFATLTLPVSAIQLGSPAVIKVDGEDQESNAWYMTFKTTLQEEVKITQNKVVARKEGPFSMSRGSTLRTWGAGLRRCPGGARKGFRLAPSRAQCTRPLSAQSGGTNPLCGSTSHRERSGRRISVFVGAVAGMDHLPRAT